MAPADSPTADNQSASKRTADSRTASKRAADSQTKKEVMATLKGETVETRVGSLIGSAFSALTGKKELPEDEED